ncbi:hypothetical protein FH608_009220 [Nonomuraea phyllanthi]|uniref:Uncharacterized protein n=1 Tax=Nonomuraea phyllanthi TaxID=2219224 RepID=A0A5C4WRR5_9ACTN|nr:DUF6461 domain-containing protein [Nonomuraea phyllanthi]KAB8195690.1 hypothetical protein FH608_009220 [Nonomuraea phyllanthi]
MTVTAADYAWFHDRFPGLWEAYCLTLIQGLRPQDVVTRLHARTEDFQPMPFGDMESAAYSGPGPYGGWPGYFLGAAALADWCLVVEPGGAMGVNQDLIRPLSQGTRLVSHSNNNANATGYFYWLEDGEIRLGFEPLFPTMRFGSDPDGSVMAMRRAGFDLGDGDRFGTAASEAARAGTAFALAEHLTGVKLTAHLLETSVYLCAVAPGTRSSSP